MSNHEQKEPSLGGQIAKTLIICLVMLAALGGLIYYGEKRNANQQPTQSSQSQKEFHTTAKSTKPAVNEHAEVEASALFENLEITNDSLTEENGFYCLKCNVKNNNSVPVYGYFRVIFYDEQDNPLYDQIVSISTIEAGTSAECSINIVSDRIPANYKTYRFVDAAIQERTPKENYIS